MKNFFKFGCLGVIVLLVFFFIIGYFTTSKEEINAAYEEGKAKSVVDTVSVQSNVPEKPTSPWIYTTEKDKMGDETKFASVMSDDILNFQFPYDGGVTSTLTVRKKRGQTDIYFRVSEGQIMAANSYDGGTIRVKFDDEKPMTLGVSGASDHSSDIIFLDSTTKILNKLKTAKKVVLEVEFFNEGKHQIEFKVDGLEW